MEFTKKTFKNGLRLITVPLKNNPTVTVMVLVEAGSNYETKKQNGISHFLEHLCFKGTSRRSLHEITTELDGMGAANNAFTGDEYTGYWAKAHYKHFPKLLDIVSDIYQNATLPPEEIEKERGVIIEEINMYEDLPQRRVWEVFSELLYDGQPAGRTIAGTKENILAFTRDEIMDYRDAHYVASGTIVVVAGRIQEKEVTRAVEKAFRLISRSKKDKKLPTKEKQSKAGLKVYQKKTDQAHFILGFRSFGARDKRNAAIEVLATILGRGMSSRLFKKMRDDLGICYYIRASQNVATDHGYFAISAGVSPKRLEEAVKAILDELRKIKNETISETELKKAKEFLLGNQALELESSDSWANFVGFQEVLEGKIESFKMASDKIRAVSAEDVHLVAEEILQNKNMNLAVVGKISSPERLKKVLVL